MKNKVSKTKKNVVCIGGGTGTFVALRGLKHYALNLSAIVSMADSGGSNRRIRDEFGLLPTSDIRQCFVALSDENGGAGVLRKLFMYRFEKGRGIRGMTFGNLFMAALADVHGSQQEAIRQTGRVLRIKGTVIPVTFTHTNLCAEYEDGTVVTQEHRIDEPRHDGKLRITRVYLRPQATANPEAVAAIAKADIIVLGPGDLYTSLVSNLLVSGIPEAMQKTRATVVYVVNLMTKFGQTWNFTASDHVKVVTRYAGRAPDYVLVSTSTLPKRVLAIYQRQEEYPVVDDLPKKNFFHIIRSELTSRTLYTKSRSDNLTRSLIRHDSEKLAEALIAISKKGGKG